MAFSIFERDITRRQVIPIPYVGGYRYSDMSYTVRVRYFQEREPNGALQAWAGVRLIDAAFPTATIANGEPMLNSTSYPFLYIKVYSSLFGTVVTAERKIDGNVYLRPGVELTCATYGQAFGADVGWKAKHPVDWQNQPVVKPAYNIGYFQAGANNIGYLGQPARAGW